MTRAVFPGTFDPPTNGHVDIITRAATAFDEVIVAAGVNQAKKRLFTDDERVEMLREVTKGFANVRVETFEGLLVDFCRQQDAQVIVKGLRSGTDFEYELQMAHMNRRLTGVDTLFLPSAPDHAFVSSSLVKEIASLGGDVTPFLPEAVLPRLVAKLHA